MRALGLHKVSTGETDGGSAPRKEHRTDAVWVTGAPRTMTPEGKPSAKGLAGKGPRVVTLTLAVQVDKHGEVSTPLPRTEA